MRDFLLYFDFCERSSLGQFFGLHLCSIVLRQCNVRHYWEISKDMGCSSFFYMFCNYAISWVDSPQVLESTSPQQGSSDLNIIVMEVQ